MASATARARRCASDFAATTAAMLALVLVLAACGDPNETAAPASPTPTVAPTPTSTPTGTATPTAAPTPTPTALTEATEGTPGPATTAEPGDVESQDCSAAGLEGDVSPQEELPEPVAETRAAIAAAAAACDYDRLVELAGEQFSYSFGTDDDPADHWRRQEESSREPLRYLVELLDRPHGTVEAPEGTQHVWPSAFAYDRWDEVPDEDREALRPLYDEEDFAFFEEFGGYIGYRIGIDADGEWLFFIAGD